MVEPSSTETCDGSQEASYSEEQPESNDDLETSAIELMPRPHQTTDQEQEEEKEEEDEERNEVDPPATATGGNSMGDIDIEPQNTIKSKNEEKDDEKIRQAVQNWMAVIKNTLRQMGAVGRQATPIVPSTSTAKSSNEEKKVNAMRRAVGVMIGTVGRIVRKNDDEAYLPQPGSYWVPEPSTVSTPADDQEQHSATSVSGDTDENLSGDTGEDRLGDFPSLPEATAIPRPEELPRAEALAPHPQTQTQSPRTTPKTSACGFRAIFCFVRVFFTVAVVATLLVCFVPPEPQDPSDPYLRWENSTEPKYPNRTIAAFMKSLPNDTVAAIEADPMSPQARAFDFVINDPHAYPEWRKVQRFALATFYYATSGDSWVANTGWLEYSVSECEWHAFSYRTIDGFWKPRFMEFLMGAVSAAPFPKHEDLVNDTVSALKHDNPCGESGNHDHKYRHLWQISNKLEGQLPPEMFLLTDLETIVFGSIDLSGGGDGSNIHGAIPTQLGQLSALKYFLVGRSELSGSIPSEIGLLSNLDALILFDCNFNGPLPSEIGQISQLRMLELRFNQLTGTVPSEVGSLSKLEYLNLVDNMLSGLPTEMGLLTRLWELSINLNQFTSIPAQVWQLTNLEIITLGGNPLAFIPSEIGHLSALKRLDLFASQLTSLPSQIGSLTELKWLTLGENPLAEIPTGIFLLTPLQVLGLHSNKLTFIPPELFTLTALENITLSSNRIDSRIPSEFGLLTKLTNLYLHDNLLYGSVPSELGRLSLIKNFWVGYNDLAGEIPNEIFDLARAGPGRTINLNFVKNELLEGSIPESVCDSGFYFDCTSRLCGCSCECPEPHGNG